MEGDTRTQPPFESFTLMMFETPKGRSLFRMAQDGDVYQLHVEQGSAANPTVKFTRTVPRETAQKLKDRLGELGVFSWDEAPQVSPRENLAQWSLALVFKKDVFSVEARGTHTVPTRFDDVLEELYRLDFPRPEAPKEPETPSFGDLPFDAGAMEGLFGAGGPNAYAFEQLQEALETMRTDPARFQQMMRDEFRALPVEQQEAFINALASTGMASRAWWERFLRGE